MKIAILGASGQLGRKTVDAVLDSGFDPSNLITAVRTPSKMDAWAAKGVEVRKADYDDPESMKTAFAGVDRLLLVPSIVMPVDRVRQYENAIFAAKAAGVRHLVHYGLVPTTIESPFVVTPFLLYAESALRISGLDWTILRNSLYADPIADWVPSIVEMGTIPYPTGDAKCAYVCRDDIARAGAAVLTTDGHAGKVYNLTGPERLTTADLCDAVAGVTGKPVVDKGAKDQDYIDACIADGEPEQFSYLLLTLYHAIGQGHLDVVSDDIEQLTGKASESFADYLQRIRRQ